MDKTHSHPAWHTQRFTKSLKLLGLLFCSLLSLPGFSQNSMWYQIDHDAKNYHVDIIPRGTNKESVMAGTVFDDNGIGQIHFLRFDDGAGGNWFPGMITIPGPVSEVYSYGSSIIYDERAVDIDVKAPGSYLITGLSRVDPSNPNPAILYSDRIKVLEVDDDGTVVNQISIYENTLPPGSWGYGLYPMNSYFKKDVFDASAVPHDLLYITGYVTMENTTLQNYPTYLTAKQIFILTLDVTTPTWTVANVMFYDNPIIPSATTHSPELDFDMGMHIDEIKTGTYPGKIFLTGSLTAKTGTHNGPPTYQYTCIRSATLSLVIDAWDLGTASVIRDKSFLDLGNLDGYGAWEYGIGMVESTDGTNQGRYIVSNKFNFNGGCDGRANNDWDNTTSFNDEALGFYVTHANASFDPTLSTGRLWYNEGWGLTLLPAPQLGITLDDAHFIISGMLRYGTTQCSVSEIISKSNITPFLYEFNINMPAAINEVSSTLKSFPNQTGTGNPASVTNAYANLGGGLSNIFWHPTFTARLSDADDIVMYAPKWDPGASRLGLKASILDKTTFDYYGNCPVDNCHIVPQASDIELVDGEPVSGSVDLITTTATSTPEGYNEGGDCIGLTTGGTPVYKPNTSVKEPQKLTRFGFSLIFPNPAKNYIDVALSKNIPDAAEMKVTIMNIYGQQVAELYKGNAAGLVSNSRLSLPEIASGMYMVHIYADGSLAHKQKLSVQH